MAGRKGNSASQDAKYFHCSFCGSSLPQIETVYPGGKEHNAKKNTINPTRPNMSFEESNSALIIITLMDLRRIALVTTPALTAS